MKVGGHPETHSHMPESVFFILIFKEDMRLNIRITIEDRVAVQTAGGDIPCGADDCTVTFTFDGEWSAYPTRTARFSYLQKDGWHYRDASFTGNTVTVPVLPEVAGVYVGVYAGDVQTAAPAFVACYAAENDTAAPAEGYGYYMPHVQADGDLVWLPSRDGLSAVPTVNIRGPQGEMGPQGPQGAKGAKGDKGDTGAVGAAGTDGLCVYTLSKMAVDMGIDIISTDKNIPVDAILVRVPTGCTVKTGDLIVARSGSVYAVSGLNGSGYYVDYTGIVLKGAAGADGYTPVRGLDYWTTDDQTAVVAATAAALPNETWTFELADGTTVQKAVVTA